MYQPVLTHSYCVAVSAVCRSFLAASRNNGNFVALIDQFLIRHGEVVTAVECGDPIFPWHVANALYLIRRVFLHLIQHFDESTIVEIFAQSRRADILVNLVSSIITVLHDLCTLSDDDFQAVYGFVVEALSFLLVLLSSQMFNSSPLYRTEFARIFDRVDSDKLFKALVILMDDKRADPRLQPIATNSGLVFGVLNFFSSGGDMSNVPEGLVHSVSRVSEALLLILSNLPGIRSSPNESPPAIVHSDTEAEAGDIIKTAEIGKDVPTAKELLFNAKPNGAEEQGCMQLSFNKIYESFIESQQRESGTLLLYTLLHENISFRTYVLRYVIFTYVIIFTYVLFSSKTDVDRLVIPLLKVLHCAGKHTSNHVYMSLVILLILSEEDSWCRQVNEIIVADSDVEFYVENQATSVKLNGINLGSLILLTIVRMIQFNLSRVKDQYLHTNCLAALANMSSR